MEYQFFQKIQKIPRWIRILLGVIVLTFGIIATLIPGIPGAIPGVIIALLFFVSARNVKRVRKIRRGLFHLFDDYSQKKLKMKWYDIKKHMKNIIFRKKR
jgi:hypothetical protein